MVPLSLCTLVQDAGTGSHICSCPACVLQTETIKWYVFAVFALAFFVARIAMAPFSVVWPAITQSTRVSATRLF